MHKHAFALMAMVSIAGQAIGADPSVKSDDLTELRELVADLQNQVDALKAQDDENWLTEKRADEIRGLVQEVLANADTRASLLQSGAVAGYDKNFFIASADNNFMMKIAGQMQVRFVYNMQDTATGDDNRWGFENRRTKLRFYGHVVDPSWQYLVLGAFDRDDNLVPAPPSGDPGDSGNFALDEAFITKDFENGWKLRVGQFKPPFLREELVSSARQLAVERSLVNEEFNQDRGQGVEIAWEGDAVRAAVMYHDGFYPGGLGTDNTPWQLEDTEFAFTGRIEFLLGDDWKRFDDMTSWQTDEGTDFLLGAAFHYQKDEGGTSGPNPFSGTISELKHLGFTVDASVEFGGINLFGALVYRTLDDDLLIDFDQFGFVIQGGFFFTDDWELFARYEFGDFDTATVEDLSVITAGVNRYYAKHALKWQTDIGFGLDQINSVWSSSGAGWRTDPTGEDGQLVIRSQFQLLF